MALAVNGFAHEDEPTVETAAALFQECRRFPPTTATSVGGCCLERHARQRGTKSTTDPMRRKRSNKKADGPAVGPAATRGRKAVRSARPAQAVAATSDGEVPSRINNASAYSFGKPTQHAQGWLRHIRCPIRSWKDRSACGRTFSQIAGGRSTDQRPIASFQIALLRWLLMCSAVPTLSTNTSSFLNSESLSGR